MKTVTLVVLLLIAGTLAAQSLSDAPSSTSKTAIPVATVTAFAAQPAPANNVNNRYRSMALVEAFKWAGIVADVETTKAAVSNTRCKEANPLFGANPGRVKMYGILGGIGAVHSYFGWKYRHSPADTKLFKITGVLTGGTHGVLAVMNSACL